MPYRIVYGRLVQQYVEERTHGVYGPLLQAIGLEKSHRIIAGVVFEEWNGKSLVCHIAADRLTREFLEIASDYAYNRCGVWKIIAPVFSDNERGKRFVRKFGFQLEAQIREATASGDILLFTMTRQQCRYLKEKMDHRQIRTSPASA